MTALNLRDLIQQRYSTTDLEWNHQWDAVLDTRLNHLFAHRSVRSYRPDPLPPNTLELLVAAAQSAASSSNLQTWSVIAVEQFDRKVQLATLASNQVHIRECPLFLVWLADLSRLTHIASQRGLPYEGLNYLEMFLMAAIDASLAAQNAAIAAESLGLGTVYIGAMRNKPEAVAEVLHLPPHAFAVFGLCVGYPNPEHLAAIKPRLPQAAVLHRETYNLGAQDDAIAHYNQVMQQFYAEQQMNVVGDWAEHSVKRVASANNLSGRDRLKEILNRMGFPLL